MAKKTGWKEKKHSLKEQRAYNVGYGLGRAKVPADVLSWMFNEIRGTVGRSSKEVLSSLKGYHRGRRHSEKK